MQKLDANNLLEVVGIMVCIIVLAGMVVTNHDPTGTYAADLKALVGLYMARGLRGILSPKRASDAQAASEQPEAAKTAAK